MGKTKESPLKPLCVQRATGPFTPSHIEVDPKRELERESERERERGGNGSRFSLNRVSPIPSCCHIFSMCLNNPGTLDECGGWGRGNGEKKKARESGPHERMTGSEKEVHYDARCESEEETKSKAGGDEEEVVFDLISSPVYLLFLCFSSSSSVDPLDLFSIWPEYPRFPTLQIPGSSPLCQHLVYMYIGRAASNSSAEGRKKSLFCLLLPRLVSTYTLCLGTRREEKNHSDGSLWD